MSKITLSNDNDFLICVLYKEFLKKRKNGISKSVARWLGSSDEIQENLMSNWSKEDVATACWELHNKGFLQCSPGDDIAYTTYLTDEGIIYMENRFSDKIEKILDYISKFIP